MASAKPTLPEKAWLFPSERVALARKGFDWRLRQFSDVHVVQSEDYNGPAPENAETLLFVLPNVNSNRGVIDPTDPVTNQGLNKIRNGCQVYMHVNSDEGYITIRSPYFENIQAGVQALRDLLNSIARDLVCRMIPLVHRSTTDCYAPILIKSTEGRGLRSRPIFRGVAKSQDDIADLNDEKDGSLGPLTADDFADAIHQAALRIRPIRGQLYTRAHLGIFCTPAREKTKASRGKVAQQCSTNQEFKAFLNKAASRGTARVSHVLGGADLARSVRDHIFQTEQTLSKLDQRYQAPDPRIESLRDTKPQYCLVFFSGDRRIEVDVRYDPHESDSPYTAATPRVFANHQKAAVVEIAVACPDNKFDWHLAVQADIGASGIPEEYYNLVRGLRFKSGNPEKDIDFPATSVNEALLLAAKIDSIACKVSWTFECRRNPYCVEVSVYHEWNDNSMANFLRRKRNYREPPKTHHIDTTGGKTCKPTHSCGISVYNQAWDDEIRELNPARREFVPNFVDSFFYHQEPLSLSGGFLEEIKYILETATADPETVGSVEGGKKPELVA